MSFDTLSLLWILMFVIIILTKGGKSALAQRRWGLFT